MRKAKLNLLLLLLMMVGSLVYGQTVTAGIDSARYRVGDTLEVDVKVAANPGLHGLYFDLYYDAEVLEFIDVKEAGFFRTIFSDNTLLYSLADGKSSGLKGGHLIVSYALDDPDKTTTSQNTLVKVKFRVKGKRPAIDSYKISFRNCEMLGLSETLIPATWVDSQPFTIVSPYEGSYIMVKEPYDNQLFYKDSVHVKMLCSEGPFKVKLENSSITGSTPTTVDVTNGILEQSLTLQAGFNVITATLTDNLGTVLAKDSVRVYRSNDESFIKIVSPKDRQLLNTDYVTVEVDSTFPVEINGVAAELAYESIYSGRVWLKDGFNTVTATARSPEGVIYKDSIQIYYRKDSSIFSFVTPVNEEIFKPKNGQLKLIKGEIDSMYSTSPDPVTGGARLNSVTIDITYKNSRGNIVRRLVNGERAIIKESDYSYGLPRSKYIFQYDFNKDLEGLEGGELLIEAYKNREGESWDDRISRVVYIDDNRLHVDLVRPNLFTSDLLDTEAKLRGFNEGQSPQATAPKAALTLSNEGALELEAAAQPVISSELDTAGTTLTNVAHMIESPEGDLYALVNAAGSRLEIYKKPFGKSRWISILTREMVYGYRLCYTGQGILVGVSNLTSSTESGLYLLKDDRFYNIDFGGAPLAHVQFIHNDRGRVYLYGNFYSNLYSFDIHRMRQGNERIEAGELGKTAFLNSFNIADFSLNSESGLALIRTESGEVYLYRKRGAAYLQEELNSGASIGGDHILAGRYETGDYNSYLILRKQATGGERATVIMEHRQSGRLIIKEVDSIAADWLKEVDPVSGAVRDVTLLGAAFRNNRFIFLYKVGTEYYSQQGAIFFENFYSEGAAERYNYTGTLSGEGYHLFSPRNGELYRGISAGKSSPLSALHKSYDQAGEARFKYFNETVEGLSGFRFYVDPLWLEEGTAAELFQFGFSLRRKAAGATGTAPTDPVIFTAAKVALKDFVNLRSDHFSISRRYDLDREKVEIHLIFNTLQTEGSYISFDVAMSPAANRITARLYGLEIFKKIIPMICKEPGVESALPMQGYVYDRTVKQIYINGRELSLGRDGAFYYDLPLTEDSREVRVNIYCRNRAGEEASLDFKVMVAASYNGIADISYKESKSGRAAYLERQVETYSRRIILSGSYYGLIGAHAGYELYAYQYLNGVKSEVLLKQGLFKNLTVTNDLTGYPGTVEPEVVGKSGYEQGTFSDETVDLVPGTQLFKIYCQNPGGKRSYFMVGGELPEVAFRISDADQEIRFNEYQITPLTGEPTPSGLNIDRRLLLECYESESAPYTFKADYELSGEVLSELKFTDLVARSYTKGLTFTNGKSEMTIPVSLGNSFRFSINVEMDELAEKDFDLVLTPTIPYLSGMKRGIRVKAVKALKGTNFIPDFSPIDPENWTSEERKTMKIPLRFKLNRSDLPLIHGSSKLIATLNYSKTLRGSIVEGGAKGLYAVVDEHNNPLYLDEIKEGINRLSWELKYENSRYGEVTISSSSQQRPGMEDHLFTYTDSSAYLPTAVEFTPELASLYYRAGGLPELKVTKDKTTELTVTMNGLPLTAKAGATESLLSYNLEQAGITGEGKNRIQLSYSERKGEPVSMNYEFLYDSKAPKVEIASLSYSEDYTTLKELIVNVKEANFSKARLHYMEGGRERICSQVPEVIIRGKERYELRWTNLLPDNIRPTPGAKFWVTAYDLSGQKGESERKEGFKDVTRPATDGVEEQLINLPLYKGFPSLFNETNFEEKAFAGHSKFAPRRFLNRESIKGLIEGKGGTLIDNSMLEQKISPDEPAADINFGYSVSIGDNYAIVGVNTVSAKVKGMAYVYERIDGVWQKSAKLNDIAGRVDDWFGLSVSISGDYAIVGASREDTKGIDAGAAYIYKRNETGWEQQKKLMAIDGVAGQGFGFSLSISGDYAIIGAPYDDFKGVNAGVAYIFKRNGSDWVQTMKLTPDKAGIGDLFGRSVSIDGDYAMVGALGDDDKGSGRGAAYIFKRDGDIWRQMDKIYSTPVPTTAGYFGGPVCLKGDYAIVGATNETNGLGAVYIFKRSGEKWLQEKRLAPIDSTPNELNWGDSVSINANGYAIVGSRENGKNGFDSGRAELFKREGNNWNLIKTLYPGDAEERINFGCNVALSNDSIIVGAQHNDERTPAIIKPGDAYIYKLNAITGVNEERTVWEAERWKLLKERKINTLSHSELTNSDNLGSSLAIDGDYAIVGASQESSNLGHGYVSIFKWMNGSWLEESKIRAELGSAADKFGISTALSGDYAIIGAPGDDDRGSNSGSAYIFKRGVSGWRQQAHLIPSMGGGNQNFGYSVSISGDYAIVGANGDGVKGAYSGSAYIFKREGESWQEIAQLIAHDGAAGDLFGQSVSISGDYAVIGAAQDDDRGNSSGSAYIFHRVGERWEQLDKLVADDGYAADCFGTVVSIRGNYAIVGSEGDDDRGNLSGSAYIFKLLNGRWQQQVKLTASDGAALGRFGSSVSITDEYALVGAGEASKSYLFHFNGYNWEEVWQVSSPEDGTGTLFGNSVAIGNSNKVLIGAKNSNSRGTGSGAAFSYDWSAAKELMELENIPNRAPAFWGDNRGSHLVFKFKKNYAKGIETVHSIKDMITFKLVGEEYDKVGSKSLTYETPITFNNLDKVKYVDDGLNLYFIADVATLKAKVTSGRTGLSFVALTDPDNHIITDNGSLIVDYSGPLTGVRPDDIYITGNGDHSLDDIIVYEDGYEGGQDLDHSNPAPELDHPFSERSLIFDTTSDERTISFWFRLEDRDLLESGRVKRLAALSAWWGDVIELEYDRDGISAKKSFGSLPLSTAIPFDRFIVGKIDEQWNQAVIKIERATKTFTLIINNQESRSAALTENDLDSLLGLKSGFYFGGNQNDTALNGDIFKGGFYSIASPFYIDKLLNAAELSRLYQLGERNTSGVSRFSMETPTDRVGAATNQLKLIGGEETFTKLENADYNSPGGGSLKLSSRHKNFLTIKPRTPMDWTGGRVIFDGAGSSLTYDLQSVTDSLNSFTITPTGGLKGRYYFGDRNSSYGLGTDRWYSVAGFVEELAPGAEASLVLVINGDEQRIKLQKGPFQLVYENPGRAAPINVKLYVESTGTVTLRNDMSFNEGNYIIPYLADREGTIIDPAVKRRMAASIGASRAKTGYVMGRSGTIAFRYKPFIINRQGSVNEEVTLFDSSYLKLGAAVAGNEEEAKYYALFKRTGAPPIELKSDVKVGWGWQFIQLSYDCDHSVAYLYVDGKVAAKLELGTGGTLPEFDLNDARAENITLGSDIGGTRYAEGFMDEILIGKYYKSSLYQIRRPLELGHYKESNSSGTIITEAMAIKNSTVPLSTVDDVRYSLRSFDGSDLSYDANDNLTAIFPINLMEKEGGRYRLQADMRINGYNYREIVTANVVSRPKFSLREHLPVIFQDESTDIWFRLRYDRSYLLESEELRYAGAVIRINRPAGETKTLYLVQDFKNRELAKWLSGEFKTGMETVRWTPLPVESGGLLKAALKDVKSTEPLEYELKTFYFYTKPGSEQLFETLPAGTTKGTIPLASLVYRKDSSAAGYEYRLRVATSEESLNGSSTLIDGKLYEQMAVEYSVKELTAESGKSPLERSGTVAIKSSGLVDLYYDDILPAYGDYSCRLKLKYRGGHYVMKELPGVLSWKRRESSEKVTGSKELKIEELSLLSIDRERDLANIYLKYHANGLQNIEASLKVISQGKVYYSESALLSALLKSRLFNGVELPEGEATVVIELKATNFFVSKELRVNNSASVPEILFTDGVDSLISYNNLLFSWKGLVDGEYRADINFRYKLDDREFTSFESRWRSVRLYNLPEGNHSFTVEAEHKGVRSAPRSIPFFVDVSRPVINPAKIRVEKLYDSHGVFDRVNIIGEAEAIVDISLERIIVNGKSIERGDRGSFSATGIPIKLDGINKIRVTAYDRVGNYSDYEVVVDNSLTTINYPRGKVKYSPITVVGRLNESVDKAVAIYLFDPFCSDRGRGDYSGWKRAKINEDRTFFIEDVQVNPGTAAQELLTTLKVATVFESGTAFEREIAVRANEILMPIELKLSTHAAEGENARTLVKIDCNANIDGISSWSIDFDGDGIYDLVELVDNPLSEAAKSKSWEHKYSSLGLVKPRVRVITTEGQFFSVSETIIIHEKIKEASNKMVEGALSLSSLYLEDSSNRLFVLKEETVEGAKKHLVEVYEVGRNKAYISDLLYTINLTALGITNPVRVRAYGKEQLLVAANNGGSGRLYELIANRFGNYEISAKGLINVESEINDFTLDSYNIYLSFINSESFLKIPVGKGPASIAVNSDGYRLLTMVNRSSDKEWLLNLYSGPRMTLPPAVTAEELNRLSYLMVESGYIAEAGEILDIARRESFKPELHRTVPVGMGSALAKDEMGLLIADYYNQRVVRLSGGLKVNEQFGSFGSGEKEFLKPALIKSYENRIFVFDEGRRDIQVFDLNFKPVCTLRYSTEPGYRNYLAPDFFQDVADIEVIAKEEGGKLYYYALILSRSKGKLAMLRLPQWEELRARVRNNKIVFLQDGELFTAKPDGSDLAKVLTTDSLPRIEGTIDYPALSPDGRSLAFTSRVELYNGMAGAGAGNIHAYDNLYLVNIESGKLKKIDPAAIRGFEIERPVFNSNGDRIIFSAKGEGLKWQIYTYDFGSEAVTKLFSSDEDARYPYYSPDDRFVVFTTNYDGDEEIEIIDTENITMRVAVTSNAARDSLPVWSRVYPHEIANESLKIESKIAFVSERDFHKGVYYLYLSRKSDSDIRVVKKDGTDVGNSPDIAAIEVTGATVEGDYPCFTGDGRSLVFEHFDGRISRLKRFSFDETDPAGLLSTMELPGSAKKPAGMKNMIADFRALNRNGNEIELRWNRYTENEIFYKVQFKVNRAGEPFVEKKIFSQTGTILKGLEMGLEYLVRVCIVENGEEVATSQWKKVEMPNIVAIPQFEVDKDNPYLIHLKGWKPKSDKKWRYVWRIDNSDHDAGLSQNFSYEFATGGTKSISLKVGPSATGTLEDVSAPMEVEIRSDIKPVIEYRVADDNSTVELSAANSLGKNINFATTEWIITGHGKSGQIVLTGPKVTADISGYSRKITVMLRVSRRPVNGQSTTDILEKTMDIDLDLKKVRPVVTYSSDEKLERLFTFSGEHSIGNIDWYRARWSIFADGKLLHREEGVSSFSYSFPESNRETLYSISLTLPSRNSGQSETVSQIISVEAEPIRPVIDYKVITIKDGANVIGSKILFDCTRSRGSNIDFSQARWTLPVAGEYQSQPTRFGPTVAYNLPGISEEAVIQVSLSLDRRNGSAPVTLTEMVRIRKDEVPAGSLVVNRALEESATGKTLFLDVLSSTGPNIDWERTEWLVDDKYSRKGPSVRVELPASSSRTKVSYLCTLYRYGGGAPEQKRGLIELDETVIRPVISSRRLSATAKNVYELSVMETAGLNIDWERTGWYIHDGHESVIQKRGGRIVHSFKTSSEQMGYPVMVELYLKGESYPFTAYTTIDVEGDELRPVIKWDSELDDNNVITFSASASKGAGIDWSQAKWSFGDSSESQYGAAVSHKYPFSQKNRSYRVSLTLSRRGIDGTTESKTVFKNITIGQDRIKPVITVLQKKGDYLVLSAEDSEGRGLMLDRAQWFFEGQGDNLSYSQSEQTGKIKTSSTSFNASVSKEFGKDGGMDGVLAAVRAELGFSDSDSTTEYDDYKNSNKSFSSSNVHTGAVCRRYLRDNRNRKVKNIVVTLFVYRASADGTLKGESITYNINIDSVNSGDELGK